MTDKTLRSLDSDLRDWCIGGCEFLRGEIDVNEGGEAERAIGVGGVGRGDEEEEAIWDGGDPAEVAHAALDSAK